MTAPAQTPGRDVPALYRGIAAAALPPENPGVAAPEDAQRELGEP